MRRLLVVFSTCLLTVSAWADPIVEIDSRGQKVRAVVWQLKKLVAKRIE